MTEQLELFGNYIAARDLKPGMKVRANGEAYEVIRKVRPGAWPDGTSFIRIESTLHMNDGYKYGENCGSTIHPERIYELA